MASLMSKMGLYSLSELTERPTTQLLILPPHDRRAHVGEEAGVVQREGGIDRCRQRRITHGFFLTFGPPNFFISRAQSRTRCQSYLFFPL